MGGRFITVDGIEGAGKSSQIDGIRAFLENRGHPVMVTREPGGTALGEEVRELLLRHRCNPMTDDAELLLVFAARAEHLARVIRPALAAGNWVLCDRFTDASYAYQGGGRGIPAARIAVLEQWVQGEFRPDLSLIFDLPVAEGLARAQRRGRADRFESEQTAFFERVRAAYRALAKAAPERCRVIDASRPMDAVSASVQQSIAELLQRHDD